MADAFFDVVAETPAAPAPEPAATTGGLTHNPNHVADAQQHLIWFFRKPRWLALLKALVEQTQEVEDAAFDVLEAFDLDTATGACLDILGRWVGEPRADRDDDNYRAAVRARVLVDSSDGTIEQLIQICTTLVPGALVVPTELQPAAMRIDVAGDLDGVTIDTIAFLLRQAKAAGVRLDLTVFDTADSFIWCEESAFAADPQGWGEDTDLDTGGSWADAV